MNVDEEGNSLVEDIQPKDGKTGTGSKIQNPGSLNSGLGE